MNKGVVFAIAAAVIWGIDYSLADRLFKHISVYTLIALEMLFGSLFFLAIGYSEMPADLATLKSKPEVLSLFLIDAIGFNVGLYLICKSIQTSNATVAGLIEISYPLFIVLATWIFFRENHVTLPIVIGGLLIFAGIIVISVFEK